MTDPKGKSAEQVAYEFVEEVWPEATEIVAGDMVMKLHPSKTREILRVELCELIQLVTQDAFKCGVEHEREKLRRYLDPSPIAKEKK